VITGRFVTRSAGNVALLSLANGTEIRATDVHPVWSVDREEWVPAGKLEPGELVDTLAGPVAVHSVDRLESALDVYNIEVHGEHVFRVTADGVLVHNAGPDCNSPNIPSVDPARVTGAALEAMRKAFAKAKSSAWMDEATQNACRYTSDQLERMRKGLAPLGNDGFPMEIHHRIPLAEGGSNVMSNFEFLTRTLHRLGENYKINHPNLP